MNLIDGLILIRLITMIRINKKFLLNCHGNLFQKIIKKNMVTHNFIDKILLDNNLSIDNNLLFELKNVSKNNYKFEEIYNELNSNKSLYEIECNIEEICLKYYKITYKNINNIKFSNLITSFKNNIQILFKDRKIKNKELKLFDFYLENNDLLVVISLTILSNCFFIRNKDSFMILKQSVISYFIKNIFSSIYKNLYARNIRKNEIIIDNNLKKEIIMIILDSFVLSNILETNNINSNKIKEKSKQYYSLNNKIIEFLIDYTDYTINLPMVTKPNKWMYNDDKDYDSCGGGYILNKKLSILNSVYDKNIAKFKINISNDGIDNINYIQERNFRINKNILTNALNNPIYINNFNNSFKTLTYDEFKSKNYDEYKKYIQKNNIYYNLIIICLLYFDKDIYFNVVSDNRGRLYYHSFPLSPQSDFLTRQLLGYYDEKNIDFESIKKDYLIYFNKIIDINSFTKYIFIKDNSKKLNIEFKDISDKFFYSTLDENNLKDNIYLTHYKSIIDKSPYKPFIYGDVSSSGFQIMGVINKDESVKYYTNLISGDDDTRSRDFYTVFFDKVKILAGEKYTKITSLFERKLYKQIIMNMGYSQKYYTRSNIVKDYIKDKYLELNCDYINSTNNKYIIKKMYSDIMKLSILFDKVFEKEFKNIYNFMKLISEYVEIKSELNDDGISLETYSSLNYVKTIQIYYHSKCQYLSSLNSDGSISKLKLAVPETIDKKINIDVIKMKNSVIPNWIHLFDANIAHNIINIFKNSNIHINTIHDSFGIKLENFPKLKITYYNSIKIINDNKKNIISCFIKSNIINNYKILMNEIKEKEKLINNLIEINKTSDDKGYITYNKKIIKNIMKENNELNKKIKKINNIDKKINKLISETEINKELEKPSIYILK